VATKLGILPLPLAAKPILVLLFVQSKLTPDVPVKAFGVIASPEHFVILLTVVIVGKGLTVIVKLLGSPVQLLYFGVTVIVAVIGFEVLFEGVKAAIFPVPVAGKLIEGLVLAQLYVVPAIELVKFIAF
jgi:hypothetical protein